MQEQRGELSPRIVRFSERAGKLRNWSDFLHKVEDNLSNTMTIRKEHLGKI